jgi:anti-sigma factor RsiW
LRNSDRQEDNGCLRYQEYISAYLDDELTAEELVELAEHLRGCTACGREMDELAAVRNILRQVEPFWAQSIPTGDFVPSLLEKVSEEVPRRQLVTDGLDRGTLPGRPFYRTGWLTALAAALLVIGGIYAYVQHDRDQMLATAPQTEKLPAEEAVTLAGLTSEDTLEEYIRVHARESSSQNLLSDYEDTVEFVGHDFQ